jgi:hypothetical protein
MGEAFREFCGMHGSTLYDAVLTSTGGSRRGFRGYRGRESG